MDCARTIGRFAVVEIPADAHAIEVDGTPIAITHLVIVPKVPFVPEDALPKDPVALYKQWRLNSFTDRCGGENSYPSNLRRS